MMSDFISWHDPTTYCWIFQKQVMELSILDHSIYVKYLVIVVERNVWKPSHANHKNLPIAKSRRPFSGLCVFDLSVVFDTVNLSWLLLLVIIPWPLSHRLAIRIEKWQTQSWENPSKLAACLYTRHTQSRALTGQFSGKEQLGTVFPWSLVPLNLYNSSGIQPFPGSLGLSFFSLPTSPAP